MASSDGIRYELNSTKQDLGLGQITEKSTCSSVQVGLLIKRGVWFKAKLVAKGFRQIFSPMVKMTTLGFMLNVMAVEDLVLIHLDVKMAFLHGDLEEEIYME